MNNTEHSEREKSSLKIEIVDGQTVRECLPMSTCIQLMSEVLVSHYQKEALVPQRLTSSLFDPDHHLMLMPAALQKPAILGVKTLTLCPDNPQRSLPAIQGLITLFDLDTGTPIALVDAASITLMRTAAASAAATQVLAREDACSLALIGTGRQAESHLQAMLAIRPINRVTVWGRSAEKARVFADRARNNIDRSIDITAATDIAIAINEADIVCTLTGSQNPIIKGEWLKPGTHINMVGAHSSDTREVDADTIKRARLFVEIKSAALKEAGDILIPLRAGEIQENHILGEVAQVILGDIAGRTHANDITAYKSLGNAAQDLAAAAKVLELARLHGRTRVIEWML